MSKEFCDPGNVSHIVDVNESDVDNPNSFFFSLQDPPKAEKDDDTLKPPKEEKDDDTLKIPKEESKVNPAPNPLENAGILSLITASWLQPLISLGANRPLEEGDVWKLCKQDECEELYNAFIKICQNQKKMRSFAWKLLITKQYEMIRIFICFFLNIVFTTLQPFFVQSILEHLQNKPTTLGISNGYVLIIGLSITSWFAVTMLNFGFFNGSRTGANMRSLCMDLVYKKALKLSSTVRQETSTGEIVTLMSADSERIFEACIIGLWIFLAPFAIVVSLIPIVWLMGWIVAGCGLLSMILIILGSLYIAKCIGQTRSNLMKITEKRVNLASETLQGIRNIKINAWEDLFLNKIKNLRDSEIQLLRKFHFWRVFNIGYMLLSSVFLAGLFFTIYVAMDEKLTISLVFTVLSFINISRFAISVFPTAIAAVSEARISSRRIDTFLNHDELIDESSENLKSDSSVYDIAVSNASFEWFMVSSNNDPNVSCLRNLTLNVERGSLLMIIGAVGSGKSSFLNALLGEMHITKGSYSIQEPISYVSQKPWIQQGSIRENILFDDEYNEQWYNQVIEACQLLPDFNILQDGDLTQLNENGMNLSGGQKARIGIARALYKQSSNIFLLDDPLSALDVHVANNIFQHVIMNVLQKKTRVLVLNSHFHLLSSADHIIIFEQGEISAQGKLEELMDKFPYLKNQINEEKVINHNSISTNKILIPNDENMEEKNEKKITPLLQEEERKRGSIPFSTYIKYFNYVGFHGGILLFSILIFYGSGQTSRMLVDWWIGKWAKDMEYHINDFNNLLWYSMMLFGLIGLTILLILGSSFFYIHLTMYASKNLHNHLFQLVLQAPINLFFDITPIGRILNRFSRDLDQIDSLLPDFMHQFLQQFFIIFGVLILCSLVNKWILIAYLPMFAIFYWIHQYFEKSSRELKRIEGITRTPIYNWFTESLNGVSIIRAYHKKIYFCEKHQEHINTNTQFCLVFWSASRWLALRLDWLAVFLIAIVGILLIVMKDSIDPSLAGLSLTYSLSLTSVLQWTVRMANMTENNMTAVERLFYFLDIPTEIIETSTTCLTRSSSSVSSLSSLSHWPENGQIEFKNMSLRYRSDLYYALKNITLTIKPKEKIGVCGRTGAGKSSLVVALFRIANYEMGSICIDGIDIQSIPLDILRYKLSIIPQDPILFNGTLRENLDPFQLCTDIEIWNSLKHVSMLEFCKNLKDGLNFNITGSGENLSVGQRQLLCIARAMLRHSSIVIIDEATANVDTETDFLIQQTMKQQFKSQTVLTVAHRLETILSCDRILVLDKGQVKEYDTPEILLNDSSSVFYSMAYNAGIVS